MKFSITFKYSNVTFKNKETKETISFDTKAQDGNSFTFDNVDEDVVIGIVKGIKDKKASAVFQYEPFRTEFVNAMARNKCKELYDKIDKEGWDVDDILVSGMTIKDLEFTRPTMNARETMTVESKFKLRKHLIRESLAHSASEIVNRLEDEYLAFYDNDAMDFGIDNFDGKDEICVSMEEQGVIDMGENPQAIYEDLKEFVLSLGCEISEEFKNERSWGFYAIVTQNDKVAEDPRQMKFSFAESSMDVVDVVFKKDGEDGTVVAFFPDERNGDMIMSYEHNGQHSDASIDYFNECEPCSEEEYAPLLTELEQVYDDCRLNVV